MQTPQPPLDHRGDPFRRGARDGLGLSAWHIVICGFTQGIGRRTGSHTLWMALNQSLSDAKTAVLLYPWHSRWSDVAEMVAVSSDTAGPPKICVYAYSWGAGYGFVQLAKQLRRRGLSIDQAVLCDPVYKSPLWSLAWLSLVHQWLGLAIHVPANVRHVQHFFQRRNVPRGAALVARSPLTHIDEGAELDRNHGWMSEAAEYQSLCKRVARESKS